jgi:hypothetical protein
LYKCEKLFLPEEGTDYVSKVYMVYAENLSFLTCMDLHKGMHGFIADREAQQLDDKCLMKSVPSVRVPAGGNYIQDDQFLRVISGKTPEFASYFPRAKLRIDVLGMIEALFKFEKKMLKEMEEITFGLMGDSQIMLRTKTGHREP